MPEISKQHWALLLGLIGLVGLAWSGSLDAIAEGYVNDSLLDAGLIYATARGINALVSALQGTELDLWLVTFSIGELLDPINDVIERFSAVMTVAITSLVIQQLLLAIVSDVTFSLALTLFGVAAVIAFVVGRLAGFRLLLKTFLIIAFLLFVGMFMETLAAIMILTPVLLPVTYNLGIDPVHFGIVMICCLSIGFATPPLGENLFVASGISNISLEEVTVKALPFAAVSALAVVLIAFVPEISLYLPRLFGY